MKKLLFTIKENWPEYLIEALVIIMSIMGAFWLESWKEAKNKTESSKSYIKNLTKNLIADSTQLQNLIVVDNRIKNNLDSALLTINGRIAFNSTNFNRYLEALAYTTDYHQNRMTFDDLVNTGNIEQLDDIDLTELLYKYYDPNRIVHRFSESILVYSRNTFGPLVLRLGRIDIYDELTLEKDIGRELLTNNELINCLKFKSYQVNEHVKILREIELIEVQALLKKIREHQALQ